ncbi:MAG: hypothetical protein DHS20C18_17750 [Saprospiraceae bacterium]|nr:MAG: hypothetical protein DHS20C18_17750 [Saprospiraceae bacterium]
MRIEGYIEHPNMKITVFKMDTRLSVKFETGNYEQTYKFRMGDLIQSFRDIEKLVDSSFMGGVLKEFERMSRISGMALERHLPRKGEEEFPDIV